MNAAGIRRNYFKFMAQYKVRVVSQMILNSRLVLNTSNIK